MAWLDRRLQEQGFYTRRFSYPTMRNTPFENAMLLDEFLGTLDDQVIHFIGHSLGGLVLHHLHHHFPQSRPGRVVTLGTPFNISSAARTLSRVLPGRLILGRSVHHGLMTNLSAWQSDRELGSIAGGRRLSLGIFLPGIDQPSDGTVAIDETRLLGMQDHIVVNATHSSLLYSEAACKQIVHFLHTGSFDH